MTRPKNAAKAAVRDFVVETEVKPDGRKIHYYEWPEPPPEPGKPVPAPPKAARAARRRV